MDSSKYKVNNSSNDTNSLVQSRFTTSQTSMDKTRVDQRSNDDSLLMHDDLEDDVFLGGALTCCGSFRFFLKHSCQDIGRHKCQFGLAFCSVFIVVLSVVIVNSVISKGPLIFLSLAEGGTGSYDGIIHGQFGDNTFRYTS